MRILIEDKISETDRVGIIKAEEWFKDFQKNPLTTMYKDFFVVATWSDWGDGQLEAKITEAICRNYSDALVVMTNRKKSR